MAPEDQSVSAMLRLRPLSESECYVRCYGKRIESVTLVEVRARPPLSREPGDPLLPETPQGERSSEPAGAGWQPLTLLAQAD